MPGVTVEGKAGSVRMPEPGRLDEWAHSSVVPGNRMTSYRQQLGIDASKIVALYSGNMAAKQGLEHLGDAATWLAGHRDFVVDAGALVDALTNRNGDAVIVSGNLFLASTSNLVPALTTTTVPSSAAT